MSSETPLTISHLVFENKLTTIAHRVQGPPGAAGYIRDVRVLATVSAISSGSVTLSKAQSDEDAGDHSTFSPPALAVGEEAAISQFMGTAGDFGDRTVLPDEHIAVKTTLNTAASITVVVDWNAPYPKVETE